MKLCDAPLWARICSPINSEEELTELRFALSHHEQVKQTLENFLYAQWLVLNRKARQELDPLMRAEYLHAANAIAELTGMIFQPDKPKPTTKTLPSV